MIGCVRTVFATAYLRKDASSPKLRSVKSAPPYFVCAALQLAAEDAVLTEMSLTAYVVRYFVRPEGDWLRQDRSDSCLFFERRWSANLSSPLRLAALWRCYSNKATEASPSKSLPWKWLIFCGQAFLRSICSSCST